MPEDMSGPIISNLGGFRDSGSQRMKQKDNMKYLEMSVAGLKSGRDGCGLLQDFKSNKYSEDDAKSKLWNHRRKSDLARERWKILAKALLKPKRNPPKSFRDVSVRRFTTFELITPNKLAGSIRYSSRPNNGNAKTQSLKNYYLQFFEPQMKHSGMVCSIAFRTDYWVSQERKYCEFCKCYISANKASIDFHENGKNHKENVSKRLTEMQKKAAKEKKDAARFENEMKRIEAAALRAYVKDIEFNPDFTSQTIGKITLPDLPEPAKKSTQPKHKPIRPPAPVKKWMEAQSEEGQTYYWHVETKESVWEVPEEGFVSLEEQNSRKLPKPKGGPAKFKKGKFGKKCKPGGGKDSAKPSEEEKGAQPEILAVPQGHPYGKWETVEIKEEGPVDLQLPKQEYVKIVVPSIKEESERKFKEKKISTPGTIESTSGEVAFKKRKFSSDPKRNMRQRLDDD